MAQAEREASAAEKPLGQQVRALMRRAGRASLATRLARERAQEQLGASDWPYASLVLVAHDHDASPLLLISDLADHSRNLAADPRLSLLYDGTAGYREALAGPRVTLHGRAERCDDTRLRARFLARHPGAALYADFSDFHLFRVVPAAAHMVAGFGAIHWIPADEVRLDCRGSAALAEAETDILAHMAEDHADAVALIARQILGLEGENWRLCGIDPEGADFERSGRWARLDFETPVDGPKSCRGALAGLTREARRKAEVK